MSRERPLTHERPHTHNPRDPHKVPAREQAHVSPKSNRNNVFSVGSGGGDGGGGGRNKAAVGGGCSGSSTGEGGASRDSCSFPSLPMSLAAWGAPAFGGRLGSETTGGGGSGGGAEFSSGAGCSNSSKQGHDVITMTKPRDVLVEGLLR